MSRQGTTEPFPREGPAARRALVQRTVGDVFLRELTTPEEDDRSLGQAASDGTPRSLKVWGRAGTHAVGDEGEPHARFGEGPMETRPVSFLVNGSASAPAAYSTLCRAPGQVKVLGESVAALCLPGYRLSDRL